MATRSKYTPNQRSEMKHLYESGMTWEQVAVAMGYPEHLSHSIRSAAVTAPGIKWSEKDDATLRQLAASGLTAQAMVNKLHRTLAAITRRANRLGVTIHRCEQNRLDWHEDPKMLAKARVIADAAIAAAGGFGGRNEARVPETHGIYVPAPGLTYREASC